jgi:hypothetical protein
MLDRSRPFGTPPYTSYRTFKTFLEDLHEKGIPSRIDRSVLTHFSGVVGTQLIHALRFLGLIEDHGTPTSQLRELVHAHGATGWSRELSELLRQGYAPMFAIDLEAATPSQFNEAFRRAFPAADAVVQKCVTFFLNAANDAGVKVSGRVLKGRKPRSAPLQRRPTKPVLVPAPIQAFDAAPPPFRPPIFPTERKNPSDMLLAHLDLKEMNEEQQAAIWTLLKYFKARGL